MLSLLAFVSLLPYVASFAAPHVSYTRIGRSGSRAVCMQSCHDPRCRWERINFAQRARVMDTYFNVVVNHTQACEVFLIEGVPAAAMMYTETRFGMPVVDAFAFNKGLLLMFDAGPHMRACLYKRYDGLVTQHAIGRTAFLLL